MSFNRRRVGLLILAVLGGGCGGGKPVPNLHYAFLSFENLSGDKNLDWVGRGTSEFLSRSLLSALGAAGSVISPDSFARTGQTLGPRPADAPGGSAARASAIATGANRLVSGYVERAGNGVRITATEEDVATHRTIRTLSASASAPFQALDQLAHEFSSQAAAAATGNPEAFRLYCTALQSPVTDAAPLLERAVSLDPGFGRAWIALIRTRISQGDRPAAGEAAQRAHAQKLAPIDAAWVNFEAAAVSGDRDLSLAAMRKISEMEAGDAGLARSLATAETNGGHFAEAAAIWKRLTANIPEDADAWNQLGYSLCWSGDYPGALAAIREYARLRPNEPNPQDSEGDVHYWFGKFSAAASSYSAVQSKAPGFLNGGEFYKAAWAKFRAGDKAGADASFAKFREWREKAHDASIDLFSADWLYRTGRAQEAHALLATASSKEGTEIPPALRVGIATQLALWDLLAGDRAAASKNLIAGGSAGISPADLLLRFAALPSASAEEWKLRVAKDFAPPQFASIRLTALGYALLLDGKREAAIPVWEEIVRQSPATDFFVRQVLAHLKNQPIEHLAPPDPLNFNPFALLADSH